MMLLKYSTTAIRQKSVYFVYDGYSIHIFTLPLGQHNLVSFLVFCFLHQKSGDDIIILHTITKTIYSQYYESKCVLGTKYVDNLVIIATTSKLIEL